MPTRSFIYIFYAAFITFCSQTVLATEQLTVAESDTMVKENIAAAQVLIEICPAFIGQNPQLEKNIQTLSNVFLQEMSTPQITLTQLYQDHEYQHILSATKQEALEVDKNEQKTACEDALNLEPH